MQTFGVSNIATFNLIAGGSTLGNVSNREVIFILFFNSQTFARVSFENWSLVAMMTRTCRCHRGKRCGQHTFCLGLERIFPEHVALWDDAYLFVMWEINHEFFEMTRIDLFPFCPSLIGHTYQFIQGTFHIVFR